MRCDECRDLLNPYSDGELSADEAATVREHLASCDECSRELAQITATSRRIKGALVRHQAPDVLKARIRSALAQTDAFASPEVVVRRPSRPRLLAGGVGIAIASGLLTFAAVKQFSPGRSIADEIVSSHIRALMPGHLTDVASTNQHNVKPWFNGRVDLSPPVPSLDSAGFPLIGGRVDYVEGRAVPVTVYSRRQHLISVYAWPEAGASRVASPIDAAKNGYNVVGWRSGGLALEAVSDLNRPELEQFVRAFSASR
jgi:anti-sigma factor RsiW